MNTSELSEKALAALRAAEEAHAKVTTATTPRGRTIASQRFIGAAKDLFLILHMERVLIGQTYR